MIDARESIRLIWRSGHDGADLARRLGVDRHVVSCPPAGARVAALANSRCSRSAFSFLSDIRAKPASNRSAVTESFRSIRSAPVESDRSTDGCPKSGKSYPNFGSVTK